MARARFRDFDGRTRVVEAHGRSGAAAERARTIALRDRAVPVAGGNVTGDMRKSRLCELWLEEVDVGERVRPQTIDRYPGIVGFSVEPALGSLRVREVTVSVADRFLKDHAVTRPSQAQSIKQVLGQIMGMAVRHDAIPSNPVRNVARLRSRRKEIRALDEEQPSAARAAVRQWRTGPDEHGHMPVGPKPSGDLADIIDIFLATGRRIGDVLAIRWSDVDLAATRPTPAVTGTLVQLKGRGIVRQDATKSDAGRRTVFLPHFAVEVLLRRQVSCPPNPNNAAFATRNGTWVSSHNVRRQWRTVREGTGLEWVTPHAFRKTVATVIDRDAESKGAAAQMGHSSEAITEGYHVVKTNLAPVFSSILDKLGPKGAGGPGVSLG